MPEIEPATSLRNFTPSSTDATSGSAATRGAALLCQIEHGQPGGGGAAAAVVKLQLVVGMRLPARSRTPVSVAVYTVDAAKGLVGATVVVFEEESYDVV